MSPTVPAFADPASDFFPVLRDHLFAQTEELLTAFPDDPDILLTAVSVYGKNRSINRAMASMTRAMERVPSNLALHGKMADMYFVNGEYERAVAEWHLTGSDPCLEDDYLSALLSLGHADEVVRCGTPRATPRRHLLLGRAYAQLGRLDDAAAALERAIEADPDYLDAHYELARVYARLQDREKAARHMSAYRTGRAAIDQDRERYARTREGGVLHDESDARLETCGVLLVDVCATGVRRLKEAGRDADATTFLDTSLAFVADANERTGEHAALLRAEAGLLLLEGSSVDSARTLARRAIEKDPTAPSYAVLGDTFKAEGKPNEARLWYQRAVDLDPGNGDFRRRLSSLSE